MTSFKRSNALSYANRKSDRDGHRIACEQRKPVVGDQVLPPVEE